MEISFFIQAHEQYFIVFNFMARHLQIPISVLPGIIFFIFAQLLLHIAYALLIWQIAYATLSFAKCFYFDAIVWACFIWFVFTITIIAANFYYFPNSEFSVVFAAHLSSEYLYAFLNIFSAFSLFLLSIAAMSLAFRILRKKLVVVLFACAFGLWCATGYFPQASGQTGHQASRQSKSTKPTNTLPNIIVIGIDSLRPDFVHFFGSANATPTLDAFLAHAMIFTHAYTPLARTFPSWTSILSGEYPKEAGIRTNLADQRHLNSKVMLPSILSKLGYFNVFATDETRFSNIGRRFGFNEVIGPPKGLNDFLLGSLNDFPLSNLIVNTRLGAWLFPYSYANRAAYITYEPHIFIERIKEALKAIEKRPLFFAVHFCLPHYPYIWSSSLEPLNGQIRYMASITRVDEQIAALMHYLKISGVLKNALVFILSDHGETLDLPGDRVTALTSYVGSHQHPTIFFPQGVEKEGFDQSTGHGTDVLGLPQYHVLLAMQSFGHQKIKPTSIANNVTLLNIKPTILTWLHQGENPDRNLLTLHSQEQHIFIESDFSPPAIHNVFPNTKRLLLEGAELFQINPKTTRLTVRPTMMRMIIKSKQVADIYGHWMIAIYPQQQGRDRIILVNLKTGRWTDDFSSALAAHAPSQSMLIALSGFYNKKWHLT